MSTQNVAARITLLCASDGEDYWRPLLETIYKFPYGKLSAAFQYILYEYLRLNEYVSCLLSSTYVELNLLLHLGRTHVSRKKQIQPCAGWQ